MDVGSPRSYQPVDEGFLSSLGWHSPCVIRRCHLCGKTLEEELGIGLSMLGLCALQVHQSSVGGSIEKYYRRTIYVP